MTTTIGDLITVLYPYYLAILDDEDEASKATAAVIDGLLNAQETDYAH